jgi:hypothetical protein
MALTREQILARRVAATEVVPAPELGDGATLTVRRLRAGDFLALSEKVKADPALAYAHWITACVVDEQGERMFTDDDAPALADLDITLIERLSDAAQRMNISKKASGPNPTPQPDGSATA